jgi:hypothetical protein
MVGLLLTIVSPLRELLHIPEDLSNYVIHLGVMGVLLVILASTTRTSRLLKSSMIIAGASALGWPISVYIHDLIFPFFPNEDVTFILVFLVLPVTFLVGTLGAIVVGIKQLVSSR